MMTPGRRDEILKPFAKAMMSMIDDLRAETDAELELFIMACDACTETNCSWVTYAAAQALNKHARRELFDRRQRARVRAVP